MSSRAGYEVTVLEASETVGGGIRSAPLTIPGFTHDLCSAVHPAAFASPVFRAIGLPKLVDWIVPEMSYAHPLEDGRAGIAWRDIERTAAGLGADRKSWLRVLQPLVEHIDEVTNLTGNQLLRFPRAPATTAKFGARALRFASSLAPRPFSTMEADALLAGVMAHANSRIPSFAAAAVGLTLAAHAHAGGWGFPRGGAQAIAEALLKELETQGGRVETGQHVTDLSVLDWGDARSGDVLLLATSPHLLLTHPETPAAYARALQRFRYGPGAAKVDFALDGPVPWINPDVGQAPTVHVGGRRTELEESENAVAAGRVSERPYVLVVQPSILDPTRAPAGKSALWAYIHVPNRSNMDPTALVIRQIERFAPGFRDRILATHAVPASLREQTNPSEIGGDILGGAITTLQTFRRPVLSPMPWRTPIPGVYLGSASTPPGPGVNGMAGWHAARSALRDAGRRVDLTDLFSEDVTT